MAEKKYLKAEDVAAYMEVSVPMAYKIIRRLNSELMAQGYLVVSGRVNKAYFEKKVYTSSCV